MEIFYLNWKNFPRCTDFILTYWTLSLQDWSLTWFHNGPSLKFAAISADSSGQHLEGWAKHERKGILKMCFKKFPKAYMLGKWEGIPFPNCFPLFIWGLFLSDIQLNHSWGTSHLLALLNLSYFWKLHHFFTFPGYTSWHRRGNTEAQSNTAAELIHSIFNWLLKTGQFFFFSPINHFTHSFEV